MTLTALLALALAVIIGITAAWWGTYRSMRRRMEALHRDNDRLQGEIETRIQLVQEKQDLKHELTQGLAHRAMSAHERNDEASPQRRDGPRDPGGEGKRIEQSARHGPLTDRAVRPIREALARAERRLDHRNREHAEALDTLTEELRSLEAKPTHAHATTRSRSIGTDRGAPSRNRGELTLERIVELADMVEHCTFAGPDAATTGTPDAIVAMPQDRSIAVDAKTPIEPFVRAMRARDGGQRQREMARVARELRANVATYARAPYGSRLPSRPEFIVLFVPGEQFLWDALEADPQLQAHAAQRNVILTSPAQLLALLQMIAVGWRRQTLAASAQKMREEGMRLCEQLRHLTEHINGRGDDLWRHVEAYNHAVSALEYALAPRARRLAELGLDPDTITANPRGTGEGSRANEAGQTSAGGDTDDDAPGSPR